MNAIDTTVAAGQGAAAVQPAPSSPPSRTVSLALSGGNALGAYEAGACEALHEAGYAIDRVSGASIGSVNAAILAGNPPQRRVEKLREFWHQASRWSSFAPGLVSGRLRDILNKLQTFETVMTGRPGLFRPRPSGFLSMLPGTPPDIGLFDNRPLLSTLPRVVDFDYLNQALVPLVIGSVDLESGEAVYFDSRRQRIEPKHLLASTAFIPGFPPVEIDGRLLGDPGMLCNLPLDPLLGEPPPGNHLCFAVDLFDARGGRPFSMDTALERVQDIAFASQTLRTIDAFRREYRLRRLLAEQAGLGRAARPDGSGAAEGPPPLARAGETEVVLLAYRPPAHEVAGKALEFSSASIRERWAAGREDMQRALALLEAGWTDSLCKKVRLWLRPVAFELFRVITYFSAQTELAPKHQPWSEPADDRWRPPLSPSRVGTPLPAPRQRCPHLPIASLDATACRGG